MHLKHLDPGQSIYLLELAPEKYKYRDVQETTAVKKASKQWIAAKSGPNRNLLKTLSSNRKNSLNISITFLKFKRGYIVHAIT